MGDVKLTSPNVRVVRAGQDPIEVQTANPDLVLWDMTRVKHKWPKFDEAPFLWLTFVAWAGARRTGAIGSEVTWEVWRDSVMDVDQVSDEDDELGSPTLPGLEPG